LAVSWIIPIAEGGAFAKRTAQRTKIAQQGVKGKWMSAPAQMEERVKPTSRSLVGWS
jgi:hypothetical protein